MKHCAEGVAHEPGVCLLLLRSVSSDEDHCDSVMYNVPIIGSANLQLSNVHSTLHFK